MENRAQSIFLSTSHDALLVLYRSGHSTPTKSSTYTSSLGCTADTAVLRHPQLCHGGDDCGCGQTGRHHRHVPGRSSDGAIWQAARTGAQQCGVHRGAAHYGCSQCPMVGASLPCIDTCGVKEDIDRAGVACRSSCLNVAYLIRLQRVNKSCRLYIERRISMDTVITLPPGPQRSCKSRAAVTQRTTL